MTVTFDPEYPVAGDSVALTSDVGDASVTLFSLTSKPTDSALTLGQIVDPQSVAVQAFTPDVPGRYEGIAVNRIELCPDPATGVILKTLSTTAWTLHVGRALDLPMIAVNGHSATLRIEVVQSSIRAASLVNMATDIARNAALDTTVAAAVAALVGETIASVDDDLMTGANSLRTAYEAHRVLTGGLPYVHQPADNTNITVTKAARDNQSAVQLVQDLATRITFHGRPGILDGSWHPNGWDTENILAVAPRCQTVAEATVLLADLKERVYERHRGETTIAHGTADNTNFLADPKKLTVAIVAYLDYISAADPTAPTGQSDGIGDAIAKFGFR